MPHMKKKKKLGEGAYGVVYEAEIEKEEGVLNALLLKEITEILKIKESLVSEN